MKTFYRSNEGDPGTWKPFNTPSGPSVSLVCPNCKNVAVLDHQITNDGSVSPSVVCPNENCNFHDFVVLADWPGYLFSFDQMYNAFLKSEEETAEQFNSQTCSLTDIDGNDICPICYFWQQMKKQLGIQIQHQ